jgi:DNA-binding MarR family transcriptional regulator
VVADNDLAQPPRTPADPGAGADKGADVGADVVAGIAEQWARERPDLDATPLLILGRIARINQLADVALRGPFAEAHLANGDFDVLAALRRTGEPYALRPVDLSRSLMVTTGGITKRLDRLEGQDLVVRNDALDDGRGKLVRLTDAGVDLVDKLIGLHLANERSLLGSLTADEQKHLGTLLGRLTASLETHR